MIATACAAGLLLLLLLLAQPGLAHRGSRLPPDTELIKFKPAAALRKRAEGPACYIRSFVEGGALRGWASEASHRSSAPPTATVAAATSAAAGEPAGTGQATSQAPPPQLNSFQAAGVRRTQARLALGHTYDRTSRRAPPASIRS